MFKIQSVPYRASKVAFNMMTACLHVEFGLGVKQVNVMESVKNEGNEEEDGEETRNMKVFCYDPGFTASHLSPHNKEEFGARSAKDTVVSIMELVEGKRDAEVGKFIHNSGGYPW